MIGVWLWRQGRGEFDWRVASRGSSRLTCLDPRKRNFESSLLFPGIGLGASSGEEKGLTWEGTGGESVTQMGSPPEISVTILPLCWASDLAWSLQALGSWR